MIKKKTFYFLFLPILVFGLSVSLQMLIASVWTEPSSSPLGTFSAPISQGKIAQGIGEGLELCSHALYNCTGPALLVPNGSIGFGATPDPNIKVEVKNGTTNAGGGLILPVKLPNSSGQTGEMWVE